MECVTRREALACAGAVAAISCAGGLWSGCQAKAKAVTITSGTVNVGPAADFPAGTVSAKFLEHYGMYLANESGTRVAIRPKCTHQGCTVKWVVGDREYECPCHHSKFSMLGLPLAGPATKPLALVTCTEEMDGTLVVDLTKLYSL
jgi:Rieske Fe-S protein